MVVGRAWEPTPTRAPSGMKESVSPIDLASLGGDGKIKLVLKDAAAAGTSSTSCRRQMKAPVRMVLRRGAKRARVCIFQGQIGLVLHLQDRRPSNVATSLPA
jgi:hypothetical protein